MVTRSQIRKYAERIGTEFRPQRVILFGSYAYGKPTEDCANDQMMT